MSTSNGRRRGGGILGIVLIGGYLVLRFGYLAWREHENGMSNGAIAGTLALGALGIFVVIEVVFAFHHAQTRRREAALALQHPGAVLLPVTMKRDLADEIERAAQMLGLPMPERAPRRGYGTVVADHAGIGIYTGGSEPRLVLGLQRQVVQSVGNGETKAAGRYAFGTRVEAVRVIVSDGRWTPIDLPVYRTVIGFPKTLRGAELDEQVRRVALAAGVQVQSA